MSDHEAKRATPHATLLAELLDSRIPKSEREHAAKREIERLTAALKKANDQAEHFERHWYLRGDEIADLRTMLGVECDSADMIARERDELRRQLAEAEQDARRYRWLRGDSCPDHSVRWTQWEVRCWRAPKWTADLRRSALDVAIDAAMGGGDAG